MKLISILKNLKGENIIIETKDNKKVVGKVSKIDSEMNIYLEKGGVGNMNVAKGCNVRYIILRKDFELPGCNKKGRDKTEKNGTECAKSRNVNKSTQEKDEIDAEAVEEEGGETITKKRKTSVDKTKKMK